MMAKTIMVANDLYEELKRRKQDNMSFTDVIRQALENKPEKTMKKLIEECAGILKPEDDDYDEKMAEAMEMWALWDKKKSA